MYELFFAATNAVKVHLTPHITPDDLVLGRLEKDICISEVENRVKSIDARCGRPGSKMNEDEVAIRNEINTSEGGFITVDEVVERIRLVHLLSYPMDMIKRRRLLARDKIKDAVESIIPCFDSNAKLTTFEDFLNKKLTEYPEFKRIPCPTGSDEKYDYGLSDGTTEYDVFKEWCSSLHDALPKL